MKKIVCTLKQKYRYNLYGFKSSWKLDFVRIIIFINNLKFLLSPVSDPSSPMSNGSNDILIGIESKNGLDEQTKRLQELGLDLDLLGIGDDQPKSANSGKSSSSAKEQKSKTKPIEDLKDLNSIFMQQQFGHVSQAQS